MAVEYFKTDAGWDSVGAAPSGDSSLSMTINTDGNPGRKIYVGATDPEVEYSDDLSEGDIWVVLSGL